MIFYIKQKYPVIFLTAGKPLDSEEKQVSEDDFWGKMKSLSSEVEKRHDEISSHLLASEDNTIELADYIFRIEQ